MACANVRGELTVIVHKAGSLRDTQFLGKQDPYAKVFIEDDESNAKKTSTHKDGHKNPTWEQALGPWTLDGNENNVIVEIYNREILKGETMCETNLEAERCADELIGVTKIDLRDVHKKKGRSGWYSVFENEEMEDKAGTVLVSLKVAPEEGQQQEDDRQEATPAEEGAAESEDTEQKQPEQVEQVEQGPSVDPKLDEFFKQFNLDAAVHVRVVTTLTQKGLRFDLLDHLEVSDLEACGVSTFQARDIAQAADAIKTTSQAQPAEQTEEKNQEETATAVAAEQSTATEETAQQPTEQTTEQPTEQTTEQPTEQTTEHKTEEKISAVVAAEAVGPQQNLEELLAGDVDVLMYDPADVFLR